MHKHIMTFDIGTTSLKAALMNRAGDIVAEGSASYRVSHPQPGWAEQDPDEIWQQICVASRQVIDRSGVSSSEISALIFVAPWKNIIALDSQGRLLHNSIIWMDARAHEQSERLNHTLGQVVGSGQEYWPRLMWLKERHPALWQRTAHIVGLNTYFKFRATGKLYTEPSDDFIRSENPQLHAWYQSILEAANLAGDIDKFPPARAATDIVGSLTPRAARQLGIASGIPVISGFGDLVAITWGADKSQLNDAHIYFGTSSWLVNVIRQRSQLAAPLYFSINAQQEGAVYPLQTGCLALEWIIEQVYRAEREQMGHDIYRLIQQEVSQVPPGCEGLIAAHWLTGELTPFAKNAKGLFLNLTTRHDRRHMVRAMMESVCFTHRHNMATLEKLTGQSRESIRVVGGGAMSAVWMQMLADILQIRVEVPASPRYSGTLGAYYCAARALGWHEEVATLAQRNSSRQIFTPNPAWRDVYQKNYAIYMQLYPALKDIYNQLNGEH